MFQIAGTPGAAGDRLLGAGLALNCTKSRMPCSSGLTPVIIVVHTSGESGGRIVSSTPLVPSRQAREVRHDAARHVVVEQLPVGAVEADEDDRRRRFRRAARSGRWASRGAVTRVGGSAPGAASPRHGAGRTATAQGGVSSCTRRKKRASPKRGPLCITIRNGRASRT